MSSVLCLHGQLRREAERREVLLIHGAAARRRAQPLADAVSMEGMASLARQPAQFLSRRHGAEADGARLAGGGGGG